MRRFNISGKGALAALGMCLSACGGGGGVSSTPTPLPVSTPTPSPTSTPTPTPTPPPVNFSTTEFQRSDGPDFHGAITAWQAGASGQGTTLAIIDSGIDATNPEFAGRISAASKDVASNRSLNNSADDHGTQVALVAAAGRNGSGVLGIAWNATVQAIRADTPGSCAETDGCSFSDVNISAALDAAVQAGARVVNLSLGGDPADALLQAAVGRAAAAGLVVVVSAGNEGLDSGPGVDPANPNPFAVSLLQAGSGNVLIVGSVDAAGIASDFSNKAGASAASVLMAQGERICCVYENGQIKTTTSADGSFVTLVSGTSFSAPQVSGAAVLLAQAFPNLTAQQIVSLLLSSARDAGDPGTDPVYGRGILDIARAFSPQGQTSLAGTSVAVPLNSLAGMTSAAMGDAVGTASLNSIILDSYVRAYSVDLARGIRSSSARQPLTQALSMPTRPVSLAANGMALAFTIDRRFGAVPLRMAPGEVERAKVLASSLATKLGPSLDIALGWNMAAGRMVAQLQQRPEPAFLIAGMGNALGERPDAGIATRYWLGKMGVTLSAERAHLAWSGRFLDQSRDRLTRFGLAFDGTQGGDINWEFAIGVMREERSVLGAKFGDALGGGGATTTSFEPGIHWLIGAGWQFHGAANIGLTRLDRGPLASGRSQLVSSAWSVDLGRDGAVLPKDRLGMRISQPLRVESGALLLNLPVAWDYATSTARFGRVPLSLAPKGREIATEAAWSAPIRGGTVSTSLFWRHNPGHFADAPDDAGMALRWSSGF